MGRPTKEKPLVAKIAQAFKSLAKLKRNGTNRGQRYKYPRATDVFNLVRRKLLEMDVLILPSEEPANYVQIPTNGGEQLTECRLFVTFLITDGTNSLPPMKANGVGRDIEDKALYKAKTGAEKYLVKQLALMVEIVDDPEHDGGEASPFDEPSEPARERHMPSADKPVTHAQIRAFNDACATSNKTTEEITAYLFHEHAVSGLKDLRRGKQFTQALAWAHQGSPAPKPQAAPPLQESMSFPKAAPSFEMRVGGKTQTVYPKVAGNVSI